MTRALIYGGREWDDQKELDRFLDTVNGTICEIVVVIHGAQKSRCMRNGKLHFFGADYQASVWASKTLSVKQELPFPARWEINGRYNHLAGFERNGRMLTEGKPEVGIEFPGGNGTRNMHNQLWWDDVPIVIYPDLKLVRRT